MKRTTINIKRSIVIFGYIVVVILSLVLIIRNASLSAATHMENRSVTRAILEQGLQKHHNFLSVVLIGVTDYEVAELFNDILEKTAGVIAAKRYRFSLYPQSPSTCRVEWQIQVGDTNPFQLESRLYRMLKYISENDSDVETIQLSIRPTPEQRRLLGKIQPWQASSREIQFRFLRTPSKNGNGYHTDRERWNHWPDTGFE